MVVDHTYGVAEALPSHDGELVVGLPLDGVVVEGLLEGHRQSVAAQVVTALSQQVQATGHATLCHITQAIVNVNSGGK